MVRARGSCPMVDGGVATGAWQGCGARAACAWRQACCSGLPQPPCTQPLQHPAARAAGGGGPHGTPPPPAGSRARLLHARPRASCPRVGERASGPLDGACARTSTPQQAHTDAAARLPQPRSLSWQPRRRTTRTGKSRSGRGGSGRPRRCGVGAGGRPGGLGGASGLASPQELASLPGAGVCPLCSAPGVWAPPVSYAPRVHTHPHPDQLPAPAPPPPRPPQGFPFFEVSAASGQAVRTLFATLFARMLATIPGIPKDAAALAVQQAQLIREQEDT